MCYSFSPNAHCHCTSGGHFRPGPSTPTGGLAGHMRHKIIILPPPQSHCTIPPGLPGTCRKCTRSFVSLLAVMESMIGVRQGENSPFRCLPLLCCFPSPSHPPAASQGSGNQVRKLTPTICSTTVRTCKNGVEKKESW